MDLDLLSLYLGIIYLKTRKQLKNNILIPLMDIYDYY